MPESIETQVVEFYSTLFERIFVDSFRGRLTRTLKLRAVVRQVEESADAASQSLTRFFLNQKTSPGEVCGILRGLSVLGSRLELENIANPSVMPETVAETLLEDPSLPEEMKSLAGDVVSRLALHSVLQVLILVGPVMAEWERLRFAGTYELPRRVVNRLNQITHQMDALGRAGQEAIDESYELLYREHLLQRFHRVETGTVRMTTNMAVDLRELFVMPQVRERRKQTGDGNGADGDEAVLMNLASARAAFSDLRRFLSGKGDQSEAEPDAVPVLEFVKKHRRIVIVGAPGGGKSTFLEWLQLKIASAEEEFALAGAQAIPLLLRVRQMNPKKLPTGAGLIEKATASTDRAASMPAGWIERQMDHGRVLFMLDGLDETEPELRDKYVLPWLRRLVRKYGKCRFVVTSRPAGYAPRDLQRGRFTECDLQDFGNEQVAEYACHWCTAVRLASHEPETEARREGEVDGRKIVDGFKGHPYIRDLARNPLMLSAICLVNYFEGGELPKDRAKLYQLCVEGLLYNWDQRRGIRSDFGLDEKLRACREVAIAMQAADRAEYDAGKVQERFAIALDDPMRAKALLEHIRYRAGLLIERRPHVYAFAHLTFQEYLAASAVDEGNTLGIDAAQFVSDHADGRWKEVIALYCGIASTPSARRVIELLLAEEGSSTLGEVLTDAYLSSRVELTRDRKLRREVITRVAGLPASYPLSLKMFPKKVVAPLANSIVGDSAGGGGFSEAFRWLQENQRFLNMTALARRAQQWRSLVNHGVTEICYLIHRFGTEAALATVAGETDLYRAPGSLLRGKHRYRFQSEVALIGLASNALMGSRSKSVDLILQRILLVLSDVGLGDSPSPLREFEEATRDLCEARSPEIVADAQGLALLARKLARKLTSKAFGDEATGPVESAVQNLTQWADRLTKGEGTEAASRDRPKSQARKRKTSGTGKRTRKVGAPGESRSPTRRTRGRKTKPPAKRGRTP